MKERSTQRDPSIDLWKGLLVILMVWAHVIQLMGDRNHSWAQREISDVVNVTAFSSFLFSFGYVTYLSYFSRQVDFRRIGASFLKILFAYYFLSIAIQLLIQPEIEAKKMVFDTLTFNTITIYTEFLTAFGLALLVGALFAKPLGWMVQSLRHMLIFSTLFLLTSFVPDVSFHSPQMALVLSAFGPEIRSYPLAEYMPLFLAGSYMARHQIKYHRTWFMIGAAGVASFYIYRVFLGFPERFPPTFEWIFFSLFFTICGYQIVRLVRAPALVSDYLSTIGANTLFFFVVSTISIIILQRHYDGLNMFATLLATTGIMTVTYFLSRLIHQVPSNG
jgi:hypothetical protein